MTPSDILEICKVHRQMWRAISPPAIRICRSCHSTCASRPQPEKPGLILSRRQKKPSCLCVLTSLRCSEQDRMQWRTGAKEFRIMSIVGGLPGSRNCRTARSGFIPCGRTEHANRSWAPPEVVHVESSHGFHTARLRTIPGIGFLVPARRGFRHSLLTWKPFSPCVSREGRPATMVLRATVRCHSR